MEEGESDEAAPRASPHGRSGVHARAKASAPLPVLAPVASGVALPLDAPRYDLPIALARPLWAGLGALAVAGGHAAAGGCGPLPTDGRHSPPGDEDEDDGLGDMAHAGGRV